MRATKLCKDTPSVVVRDNRGLTVRNVEYNRVIEGGERQLYITRHVFDASGELQSSADPRRALQSNSTPNFSYKRMLSGQQVRMESVDAGTQVQLQDARGLLIWSADSNMHRKRWEYDALGRSTRYFEQTTNDNEESCRERFFYGDADSEAGQNLRGCLIRHADTAGCVQISSYALIGKPLNEARRFLSSLDEPNWPKDKEAGEALLEEYSYTTRRTYNALGELLTETDAAGHRKRYEQNLAGQSKAVWLQLADQEEHQIASNLAYNAWGAPIQLRMGNGVVRAYEYEVTTQRLSRLGAVREKDQTMLQDLRYTYDPVGNVISVEDKVQPTRYTRNQRVDPTATYEYDACYQLLSATGRESAQAIQQGPSLSGLQNFDDTQLVNYTRRYTYDPSGNLCKTQHTGAQSYALNMTVSSRSNRVVPEEWEATPEQVDNYFDSKGNLKQLQPGQPLVWNGLNQLSRVVQIDRPSNPDDERYIYASASQRVRKMRCWLAGNQQHTEEVRYLPGIEWREQCQADVNNASTARVNENLQVLSVDAGGMFLRLLHWEIGQPDDITNDQARYSLDNHLGSSTLELDGEGNKLTYEEYYPYGGTSVWSSKSTSEAKYKYVRYCGKERDATGLYYYGYRYYAPWLGRWINPDPAGTVDGLNPYRMVRNNPIKLLDQDGLAPTDANERRTSAMYFKAAPEYFSASYFMTAAHPMAEGANYRNRVEVSSREGTPYPFAIDKYQLDRVGTSVIVKLTAVHEPIDDSNRDQFVSAYWAPQGGHVDVPAHPNLQNNEAEFVFTPDFSGCSIMADQIQRDGRDFYRFRHVEGDSGMETDANGNRRFVSPHLRAQYFGLGFTEEGELTPEFASHHGKGLAGIMNYEDYGFTAGEQTRMGFAYAKYNRSGRRWQIHWQHKSDTHFSIGANNAPTNIVGDAPRVLAAGSRAIDTLGARRRASTSDLPRQ